MTRKIYRAFPELDRFSDEQCRRFVSAANASISRRFGRGTVAVVAAAAMAIFGIRIVVPIAQNLSDRWRLDEPWYWLFWGTWLTLALVAAFVPGLVLADGLLRLRVRSMLKRCGACPLCRYSLLGMRVGSDRVVTCPECGHQIKVEPAFGELATDDSGAAVYRPEIVRDDEASIVLRKRRRWKIMKWSAATVCVLLVLVGGGVGYFLWFVNAQAVAARAAREPVSRMREIQAAALGVEAGDEGDHKAEWERFGEIISGPQYVINQQSRLPDHAAIMLTQNWDSGPLRKLSALPSDSPVRHMTEEHRDGQRRAILKVLDQCRTDGAFERLENLSDFRNALRPLPDANRDNPIGAFGMGDAGAAYTLANVQTARMIEAIKAGDLEEYLKSVDQTLQVADILDRQLKLSDRSSASALRGLLLRGILLDVREYPDLRWHTEVMKRLAAHESRPPIAASLRMHHFQSRDYVDWFFSDPARVRESTFGISQFMNNPTLGAFSGPRMTVGTYRENSETLDSIMEFWIKEAEKPCREQSTLPPGSRGLSLVSWSVDWLFQLIKNHETAAFQYRAAAVSVAVERFRREHGRLPDASEMRKLDVPAEFLIDPISGKPFGLQLTPTGSPHPLPFEVVGGRTDLSEEQSPQPAP